MKYKRKKFLQDLLQLLTDYKEFANFKNLITTVKSELKKVEQFSDDLDDPKLNGEISPLTEHDIIMSVSYTAANNMAEKNVPTFLLELGEMAIKHGFFNEALSILGNVKEKTKYSEFKAEVLILISDTLCKQVNWEKSKEAIEEAEIIYQNKGDVRGMALCKKNLGTILSEQGELELSLNHYQESLRFAEAVQDLRLEAIIEMNIGQLYNYLEIFDKSLVVFNKALRKLEKINDIELIAELKKDMAVTYANQNKLKMALRKINECIDIALIKSMQDILAFAYHFKTKLFIKVNNYELAALSVDKALEACRKIDDKLLIADIYLDKGVIERQLKHYSKAEVYYNSIKKINKEGVYQTLNYKSDSITLH